jgi:hypothetical protein
LGGLTTLIDNSRRFPKRRLVRKQQIFKVINDAREPF